MCSVPVNIDILVAVVQLKSKTSWSKVTKRFGIIWTTKSKTEGKSPKNVVDSLYDVGWISIGMEIKILTKNDFFTNIGWNIKAPVIWPLTRYESFQPLAWDDATSNAWACDKAN